MTKKTNIVFGFIAVLSIFLTACSGQSLQQADENVYSFASCMTESGAIMYGTEWCPHCTDQKRLFGSAFEDINYIDCDKNRDACISAGIQGYPTWIIDGRAYPGKQELSRLSELTSCPLA